MSRQLHPLLSEAFASGYIAHDGRRFELHSNIPEDECRLFYRQVEAVGAATALEIGMGYGVSSVALADAVRSGTETPTLISIDPYQLERWNGVAVGQLERAGFSGFHELIEAPSHVVLRNRPYELLASVPLPRSPRARFRRTITDRPALAPAAAAVTLGKSADDERPWHDYRSFAS